MADLTITPANVVSSSGTRETGTAGASITAGQVVALDSSTGRLVLAGSNHATAALRIPRGIALHAAANGQPLTILTQGDITIGATVTAGTDYWLSDTPGGICPRADVASGERVVLLGLAKSASVLALKIHDSGVTLYSVVRDQRIAIYRRSVSGQNSFGEDAVTPVAIASSLSACVEPLSGRELELVAQKWAEARYRIRIGWQPYEIKREDWIEWKGATLDILDIQGAGTRALEWVLIAKDHLE